MDIFEFAMKKEKYAEDYYIELSKKTGNEGLRNILKMLAGEERKHLHVVQQMQKESPQTVTETDVLKDAREAFERMRTSTENFNLDVEELQLYEKARDIEKDSRQFYSEKAEQATEARHKEIFTKLANEEKKHQLLLERICDFVAKPQWFLENAEMYRFDDYAQGTL